MFWIEGRRTRACMCTCDEWIEEWLRRRRNCSFQYKPTPLDHTAAETWRHRNKLGKYRHLAPSAGKPEGKMTNNILPTGLFVWASHYWGCKRCNNVDTEFRFPYITQYQANTYPENYYGQLPGVWRHCSDWISMHDMFHKPCPSTRLPELWSEIIAQSYFAGILKLMQLFASYILTTKQLKNRI